jgi:hypothetical protein
MGVFVLYDIYSKNILIMGQRLIISEEEKNEIGNMYGLVNEQDDKTIEVTPENAYNELKKLNVSSTMKGTRYQDQLKFDNLIIKPVKFHALGRSDETVELVKENTTVGVVYGVNYKGNNIIYFTSNKEQPYIPASKYISPR